MLHARLITAIGVLSLLAGTASAQDMPADYAAVLKTLGRPATSRTTSSRSTSRATTCKVTVAGVPTPTPFGFGGWLAMTKGDGGMDVMMGDLVLTEDEVNPVMSAAARQRPRRHRAAQSLLLGAAAHLLHARARAWARRPSWRRKIKPAIDLIGTRSAAVQRRRRRRPPAAAADRSTRRAAKIIGTPGEQTGPVYKITIGRADLEMTRAGRARSTRAWASTPGPRSPAPTTTPWWPATSRCSRRSDARAEGAARERPQTSSRFITT